MFNTDQNKKHPIFTQKDIERGEYLFNAIFPDSMITDLSKPITATDKECQEKISYFIHHKRLNTDDTRTVLCYLISRKYYSMITITDESYEAAVEYWDFIFIQVLKTYIKSRDYKILQFLYTPKNKFTFRELMCQIISEMPAHSIWVLSVFSWDLNFIKFFYRDIFTAIPPDLRESMNNTVSVDDSCYRALLNLGNETQQHKIRLIQKLKIKKRNSK